VDSAPGTALDGVAAAKLRLLADGARDELTKNILPFWERHGRDLASGGFYGFLGNDNEGDASIDRSVVMTSRHLWAYSASSLELGDASWLDMADYAYDALSRDFFDRESGGVFWSVTREGKAADSRKQVYGEAFAMYALSEYSIALREIRGDPGLADGVLGEALAIYALLESRARDRSLGGYVEARARDWSPTSVLKLSEKDIDCDKSMNTNLHVMEALTALHRALRRVPDRPGELASVGESLSSVIAVTIDRVLGADRHLDLYFDAGWKLIGNAISYGHDIEASWLLWEAAEELADRELADRVKTVSIDIARVALAEGFDAKAGAMESELHGLRRDRTRVWWCQAEALVGFFNAWELSGDRAFLGAALAQWKWIRDFQRDGVRGDWFASVGVDGKPDLAEPKGGNWKASYHNARCCIELMRRVDAIANRDGLPTGAKA
jgi:cellobiose epimerase